MTICKMKCEQIIGTDQDDKPKCIQSCESYHKEKGKWERDTGGGDQSGDSSRPQRASINYKQQQESDHPYVFEDQHYTKRLETEHGSVRFLQKFTDRSELFRGIEKYRAAVLEVEPRTFVEPSHWDADALAFVANGKGTITLIEGKSRRSYNIKRGDLIRVPVGISVYLVNTDDNERLVLAKILHSVSVPGELEFFGAGDGFLDAFSHEVLEAAFEGDRESIKKMFGHQKVEQGVFRKATPEQIRSLAGGDKGGLWPFGERTEKDRHTSIYKKDPSVENENGILHEVNSKDFHDLEDINVAFSFFNISQGSIAGPFYNTKATHVLMVSNGAGRFEMACPHMSEQTSDGQIHPRYQKVSSELSRWTTVVVPVGHPVVIEALGDQNLEVIGFGLNSVKNEWFPLAGQDNVMSQWEDTALELTFGFPAKQVRSVLKKQHEKLFFKAPAKSGRAFA